MKASKRFVLRCIVKSERWHAPQDPKERTAAEVRENGDSGGWKELGTLKEAGWTVNSQGETGQVDPKI